MAQTFQQRRQQFHLLRLGEGLDPFNPNVRDFIEQGKDFFYRQSGDLVGAQQGALQLLSDIRAQQAPSLAYFDVFWVAAVGAAALVVLVLLMKRSVVEKGTHLAAEWRLGPISRPQRHESMGRFCWPLIRLIRRRPCHP